MPATKPVVEAWKRIEKRVGTKGLHPPTKPGKYDEVFEFALDTLWLPEALHASYARHDGESKATVCPPLRLASFEEAVEFALAMVQQPIELPEVKRAAAASTKLSKKHAAAARKAGVGSSTEYSGMWTLALGAPGHRVVLDLDAGWVIEERADGSVVKLADDFIAWLESLSEAPAPAETKPKAKAQSKAPGAVVDRFHADFKKQHGAPTSYRAFDAAAKKRLKGRVSDWFLKVLELDGFASYADGLLWTCDPDDWKALAKLWTVKGEVIGRSAFGDTFIWDGEFVLVASPENRKAQGLTQGLDWFFSALSRREYVTPVFGSARMLSSAVKAHGALAWNEAFFWRTDVAYRTECTRQPLLDGTRLALGDSPPTVKRF